MFIFLFYLFENWLYCWLLFNENRLLANYCWLLLLYCGLFIDWYWLLLLLENWLLLFFCWLLLFDYFYWFLFVVKLLVLVGFSACYFLTSSNLVFKILVIFLLRNIWILLLFGFALLICFLKFKYSASLIFRTFELTYLSTFYLQSGWENEPL